MTMSNTQPTLTDDTGTAFPNDVYTPTTQACYSSQQKVAQAWADGMLPTHNTTGSACKLYSSPNFKGYQYADGSGKLKHYRTIECIRTRSQLILNNSECYAKGWAHCSTPAYQDIDFTLPLTTLEGRTDFGNVRGIKEVVNIDDHPALTDDHYAVLHEDEKSVLVTRDSMVSDVEPTPEELFDKLEKHGDDYTPVLRVDK